jgi:mono/diheme cytochrome c family protein
MKQANRVADSSTTRLIALGAVLGFSLLLTLASAPVQVASSPAPVSQNQTADEIPEAAKKMKNPVKPGPDSIKKGNTLFEGNNCAACHGETGLGDGMMAAALNPKPANLTDKKRMEAFSDGELFWLISEGKSAMPPFKDTLKKTDIWNLVNYVRSLAK